MKYLMLSVALAASFVGAAEFAPVKVQGKARPGAVVVACTGELTECDADGNWELTVKAPGVYAFKAMANDFADAYAGMVKVPCAEPVEIKMEPDAGRKVVRGKTARPMLLEITADGEPVRSFDVAGTPIGSFAAPKGMWHHPTRNFFSWGEYAFTEKSSHKIIERREYPQMRERGWFKGEFHGHIVHGENFYRTGLPLVAAIARATGYDWIYFAQVYSNDGVEISYDEGMELCEYLSKDSPTIVALNSEWPKNVSGHFASIGAGAPLGYVNEWKVTSYEALKERVYDRGGIAVPVHPLYNDLNNKKKVRADKPPAAWMINKEIFLWLTCNPEMCPILDLFYSNKFTRECVKFYADLLDRGYRIGVSGTSDDAFDVGRTSGTPDRPATFARLDELSFKAVEQAFRERRTMASYNGAGVVIDVGGKTSGDIIAAPVKGLAARIEVYDNSGIELDLHILRGGRDEDVRKVTPDADGFAQVELTIDEERDSWLFAYTSAAKDKHGRAHAVASAVYFRTPGFTPPEVLPFPQPFPEELRDTLMFLDPDTELRSMEFFDKVRGMIRKATL